MTEKPYEIIQRNLISIAREEKTKSCQSGKLLDGVLDALVASDSQRMKIIELENQVSILSKLHQEEIDQERFLADFRDLGSVDKERLDRLTKAQLKSLVKHLGSALYVVVDWSMSDDKKEKMNDIQEDVRKIITEY